MTRVKICGVTTAEDARLAAELGAFAIGLVFWTRSPRHVSVAAARQIVETLPPGLEAVGVFVDEPADEVRRIVREVGLSGVQLHGSENPAEYSIDAKTLIKAVPLRDADDAVSAVKLPASVVPLLDAHDPVKRGGTGRTVDWTLAARVAAERSVVLSGGLAPGNVAAAIQLVRPYAVDVSSGVEQRPGRKDPEKLRAFFAAVRAS